MKQMYKKFVFAPHNTGSLSFQRSNFSRLQSTLHSKKISTGRRENDLAVSWDPFDHPFFRDPYDDVWFSKNFLDRKWASPFVRHQPSTNHSTTTPIRSPLVDVKENEKHYELKADMPGVSRENIKLEFNQRDSTLTLNAEVRNEKSNGGKGDEVDANEKYHYVERTYQKFTRSFKLPENVDASQITADYKDGVLTVVIPKSKEEISKKLEIKIN